MMMGLVPPNIDKPHFKPSPGMVSNIPRMTRFLWNYAHFDRIAKQALPAIEKHCYSIPIEVLPQLDEKQILIKLDELHGLYRQISHHTIIVQMMMHIYNRILKSLLERKGIDFHLFDLTEGMPESDCLIPISPLRT